MRNGAFVMLFSALVSVSSPPSLQAQTIFTDHNPDATTMPSAWVPNIGWAYTPAQTFFLNTIQTRFGIDGGTTAGPERSVTVELRSSPNGAVLGWAIFLTSTDAATWVGGSFADVLVNAGTTYFIDFLNVGGGTLGTNTTGLATSGEFSALEFARYNTDTFLGNEGDVYDPIIRISGREVDVVPTPEPASLTLLATGLVGMIGACRRGAVVRGELH